MYKYRTDKYVSKLSLFDKRDGKIRENKGHGKKQSYPQQKRK